MPGLLSVYKLKPAVAWASCMISVSKWTWSRSRQFCSKFIYEVDLEAVGVKIGTLETFRELLTKNPSNPFCFGSCGFAVGSRGNA